VLWLRLELLLVAVVLLVAPAVGLAKPLPTTGLLTTGLILLLIGSSSLTPQQFFSQA
jgi:hypothetical protein